MIGPRPQEVKPVPSIGVPFAPIPLDVARRRDISSLAKLVFSVIANNARMRQSDSALTNSQIADAVGASVAAVRRALDELEKAGLIERRFGVSERVRDAIAVTYSPTRVARPCATPAPPAARIEQPGCSPASHKVARPCATPLNTKNEERSENAPAPDSRGGEPRPTPKEIADGIRAMIAGKWSAEMFDGTKAASTEPPPSGDRRTPDMATMARRVGYSAVAAIVQARAPRKTAAQQIEELRRSSGSRIAGRRIDDPRPVVGDLAFQDGRDVFGDRAAPPMRGD